ncbi:MAG: plasmid mobilization protein [Solirubrobacteraceae bacterium]
MPERKRRAAPPRAHRIELHVTEQEYTELQARTRRYAHGTVAAYLRAAGLGRRMDPAPPTAPEVNRDAYMAFLRVGGLVNQTAHHLNQGHIYTTPAQLAEFRGLLNDLARAINDVARLLIRPE